MYYTVIKHDGICCLKPGCFLSIYMYDTKNNCFILARLFQNTEEWTFPIFVLEMRDEMYN